MTLRLTLVTVAICLLTALAHPNSAPGASPIAKPTPVGLQYDEITRMAIPPATPIPVGAFQSDYAAIMNPSAQSASAAGYSDEMAAAMKAAGVKMPASMSNMMSGALLRYAYFKGWVRVDDPVKQTAEIRKCDIHQFVELNLQKKTYSVSGQSMMQQETAAGAAASGPAMYGTIKMVVASKGTALGPQSIDGVATNGYNLVNSMSITDVTGNCGQKGLMTTLMTEYVSGIHQPRAFCPMALTGMPYGGSCKPTMTNHASGAVPASDRLVMYSKMASLPPGVTDPNAAVGAFVMERGNVKVLFLPDAQALFTVPKDFTKE